MTTDLTKARAIKRLRQLGLEEHIKKAFARPKPVVFVAGPTVYINADRPK